jgi:hypothetical protein
LTEKLPTLQQDFAPVVIRPWSMADAQIDLSPQAIAEHIQQHNAIVEVAHKVLKYERDYGPAFPGAKKNAIYKVGVDTMMSLMRLRAEYEILPQSIVQDDPPYYKYVVKCRIFYGDNQVGESVRSCSSAEKKYKYRWCWESEFKHDPDLSSYDPRTLPRKKAGSGFMFRIPNPEIGDLENTILAMAVKRARTDAFLSRTGLSSDFCDESIEAEVRTYEGNEPPAFDDEKPPRKNKKGADKRDSTPDDGRQSIDVWLGGIMSITPESFPGVHAILCAHIRDNHPGTRPETPAWEDLTVEELREAYEYLKTDLFRQELTEESIDYVWRK